MNRTRATLVASLLLLAVTAAGTMGAAAHEGEGILTLESQEVAPDGGASYQVRLTWENDGHAAIDSTVTATPIAPDGTPGTPIVLQPVDQDGRYAGSLTFGDSGTWTVRFTSVTPAATSEVVEEITIATTTTASAEPATTTTAAVLEELPADPVDEVAAGELDDDGGDGGSSTGAVVALVAVGLLLAAIVAGFARSNRRLRDGP